MQRLCSGRRLAFAAIALLLLSIPVDTAGAASPPPPDHERALNALRGAEEAQTQGRKRQQEPSGRPASPGAMSAGRLSCGDKITRNTTLTADVGPCPTTGIIIGADNITLNLNGHTISGSPGPGNGNAAGIRLPFRSGVTITGHPGNSGKTGTVTGFDAGVFINGGSNNTVEKLVVRDNVGPADVNSVLGDGIALFHSSNNRLLNNVLTGNGIFDGIAVLGVDSDDNLIQGNVVEKSTDEGLGEPFVPGPTAGLGSGIIISPFLEEGDQRRGQSVFNNSVIDNVIRNNVASGVSNLANVGGVTKSNTIEGNGFRADGSPGNHPGNGIGAQHLANSTPDTFNLIEDNEIHNNLAIGILILNSHENRVVGNRTSGNGFDLGDVVHYSTGIPCERNTWFGNSWAGVTGFEQYGSYYAECTSAGGTGPRPSICALFNTVDDPGCVPLEE